MDESNKCLTHLGGSFAKLLAYAVLDLFPQAQLICDWVKEDKFSYQFILKNKIDLVDLTVIEDRITYLQNTPLEFKFMEMVPSNAAELFRAQNQYGLERALKRLAEPTINVIQINQFYDLNCFGASSEDAKKSFKLLSYKIEDKEKNTFLTITGLAAQNKEELKKLLKAHKSLEKNSHTDIGPNLSLFNEELFLPKGLKLLKYLKKEIDTLFQSNQFEEIKLLDQKNDFKKRLIGSGVLTLGSKYFLWHQKGRKSKNPLEYGLFKIKNHTCDHWISIVNSTSIVNECISCLNFYKQIIKILGFSYRVKVQGDSCSKLYEIISSALEQADLKAEYIKGKDFEVCFEILDCYERTVLKPFWKIERVSLKEGGDCYAIEGTVCTSLEMLLAQLIEHYKGKLPLKWGGEQLKILTLDEGQTYAMELYEFFKRNNILVTIDSSEQKLSAKLSRACKEKVPNLAIIGKKELEQNKLTVRTQSFSGEKRCSKEELLEDLVKQLKEI